MSSEEKERALLVPMREADYEALKPVDIIASGYEFDCPDCTEYNTLIAIPKHGTAVECHKCKRRFRVEDAMDAQS